MSTHAHVARKRYRLDNAANVYPAIRSRHQPGLFRVSATLKEPVQPDLLQQALNTTLRRIPSFSVRMRSGLFWHYFSHSNDVIRIQEDVINPCMSLSSRKDDGFQIRVRYHGRRIALEVFHSISDGSGAMTFLKTLLAQYLTLRGISVPPTQGVLNCGESPRPGEVVDEFRAFVGRSPTKSRKECRAYHVSGTKLPYHDITIITGTLSVEAVKAVSKRHGISITEYLTAVYLTVLNDIQKTQYPHRALPVKVQVPVNLRRFRATETLRNFASYVCPGIDPAHGDYTFEEILSSVHHFMRYEVTDKHLRSRVATNIQTERNLLVRMLPLFVKDRVINLGYKLAGPAIYTSVLTNLGDIKVPAAMAQHVETFDFTLGASQETNLNCAILGYAGNLRINFTRVIEEPLVERGFFTFLIRQGIPVRVESNKE